jgi:hypothetical protein
MFDYNCKLCCKSDEWCSDGLCSKCEKIKHLIKIYDDKVYETLDRVLIRTDKGLESKTKSELVDEKTKLDDLIKKKPIS